MALQYTIIKQQNPGDRDEVIYFARAVSTGSVDLDDLTGELEMMSTLSGADIHGVLFGFIDRIAHHLSEGRIVRLGDLGSLRTSLNSEKRYSEEDVDESSILGVRPLFQPGKPIRQALNRVQFRKMKE